MNKFVKNCKSLSKNPKVFKKNAVIHVTKENEKGVFNMTDGIGRIGSSNYGLGGSFYRANKEVKEEPKAQPQTVKPETNDIDPDKVLDLLNQASSIYMPVAKTDKVTVNLPKAVQDRIAGFISNFENVYAVAKEEVGAELAPVILDLMSEKTVADIK